MNKIVECIPNFSEGRDPGVIDAIASAIAAVEGVFVLDKTMDADHHRSVITFAGEPEGVLEASVRAVAAAAELIDLTTHEGEHPRIGALDVLPFVPIKGVTMSDCVALARRAGERIARELHIPAYLYEHAATRPERIDLANIRKGQFEGLKEDIKSDPNREPDFGDLQVHPTAGAIAIGARSPLIAYNINLGTSDLSIAKKIARAIRGRDGGLKFVKALGFELAGRGQVQVSMNLVNFEATPIFRVFEMVKREAERYGAPVVGSEIIGLIPQAALNACSEFYLQIENFKPDIVLENRLQNALDGALPPDDSGEPTLKEFVEEVSSVSSTPASGGVAAYVQGLAAALGIMLCKVIEAEEPEIEELLAELEEIRRDALAAVEDDADNFSLLLDADALPDETEAERFARQAALEHAVRRAMAVPQRMIDNAFQALELMSELSEIGNAGLFPELPSAAQFALATMRASYYGFCARMSELDDTELVESRRSEAQELITRGQELVDQIEELYLREQV